MIPIAPAVMSRGTRLKGGLKEYEFARLKFWIAVRLSWVNGSDQGRRECRKKSRRLTELPVVFMIDIMNGLRVRGQVRRKEKRPWAF